MACSQYEYVKKFEVHSTLLPNTYIVVRIDGKGFTKFTASHNFVKPNDKRGLDLMNKAAESVMENFNEIMLAYGQSDEFSFVFKKSAEIYQRRTDKIVSCLVSCFTAAYAMHFKDFFGVCPSFLPIFDGRAIIYPDFKILRDYLSWRQVDCHINNLYNTCFWTMVQKGGMTPQAAQTILKDTLSDKKNEILFSDYGINYSKLEPQNRKGSTLIRIHVLKEKHANQDSLADEKGESSGLQQTQVENDKQKQCEKEGIEVSEGSDKIADKKEEGDEEEEEKQVEDEQAEQNYISKPKNEQEQAHQQNSKKPKKLSQKKLDKIKKSTLRMKIITIFDDIIQDEFWKQYKDSLQLQD